MDRYIREMYCIRKDTLSVQSIAQMREDLTLKRRESEVFAFGTGKDKAVELVLYDEDEEWFRVPRWWGIQHFGDAEDRTEKGWKIDLEFSGELGCRPEWKGQKKCFADMVEKAPENYGGLVHAPGGLGKTTLGCAFIASMGISTIVLVHKDFLLDQWKTEIGKFLGIGDDEVGTVRQDVCDFEGKPIVIAMVQSIISHEYPQEMLDSFGLCVTDEIQRFGAEKWHLAIKKFSSWLRVGLSATLRRSDGLANVFRWHTGPVIGNMKDPGVMSCSVRIVERELSLSESELRRWKDGGWNGPATEKQLWFLGKLISISLDSNFVKMTKREASGLIGRAKKGENVSEIVREHIVGEDEVINGNNERWNKARIESDIAELSDRNEWLALQLIGLCREGRTVLALTSRLVQVDEIKRLIEEMDSGYVRIGEVTGRVKDVIAEAQAKNLLLGTFQKIKEGYNVPRLDTLVLMTPMSDVEQALYRIMRAFDGKKEPLVVDVVDVHPATLRMARSRRRQYDRLKMDVEVSKGGERR